MYIPPCIILFYLWLTLQRRMLQEALAGIPLVCVLLLEGEMIELALRKGKVARSFLIDQHALRHNIKPVRSNIL